jgi:predicted ATP-dependent endonuclease of OLD family
VKLNQIHIKNFRSIEDQKFDFGCYGCKILVGINESGKSSILNAMNLLSKDVLPTLALKRIERPTDQSISEAFVQFQFLASDNEIDQIVENLSKKIISLTDDAPIITIGKSTQTFKQFISSRRLAVHHVDILKQIKETIYAEISEKEKATILTGWVFVDPAKLPEPTKVFLSVPENTSIVLVGREIIDLSAVSVSGTPPWATPLNVSHLNQMVGEELIELLNNNLPSVLLWDYQKENMLPGEISIEDFAANPDICKPLKSMFELASIREIGKEITDSRALTIHAFKSLLKRVSEAATKHLKEVWQDYKDVRLILEPNGPLLTISIVDDDTSFSFEQRSDGFKRFLTLLLMVSARVKSKNLSNMLLLFDEPEISLHPSGIRNLRDELLRISEDNYVVVSTHSPFMVDRKNIQRHLIVKKKKEITTASQIEDDSRVYDEEVLFTALGTSVFEVISDSNVICEGWRDKHLLSIFRDSKKKDPVFEMFAKVGLCHANGVKDIKNLVPVFQVCNRKVIILTDADAPAIERMKEHRDNRCHGEWITYKDAFPEGPNIDTVEDFVVKKALVEATTHANAATDSNVSIIEDNLPDIGRASFVKATVKVALADTVRVNLWMNEWKSAIFDNLKTTQIEPRFSQLAAYLILKLSS